MTCWNVKRSSRAPPTAPPSNIVRTQSATVGGASKAGAWLQANGCPHPKSHISVVQLDPLTGPLKSQKSAARAGLLVEQSASRGFAAPAPHTPTKYLRGNAAAQHQGQPPPTPAALLVGAAGGRSLHSRQPRHRACPVLLCRTAARAAAAEFSVVNTTGGLVGMDGGELQSCGAAPLACTEPPGGAAPFPAHARTALCHGC